MNAAARQGDCLLDVVGPTPVVRLQRVRPEGGAEIWVKLEHLNPSGSVEDRVGAGLLGAGPVRALPDRAIAVTLAARVRGVTCEVSLTAPPTHEQREMLRLLDAKIVEGGEPSGSRGTSRARGVESGQSRGTAATTSEISRAERVRDEQARGAAATVGTSRAERVRDEQARGAAATVGTSRAERVRDEQVHGAATTNETSRAERVRDEQVHGAATTNETSRAERADLAQSPDVTAAFRTTLGVEVAAWIKALEPPLNLALIVAPAELAAALDQAGVPILPTPDVPAAEAAAMTSRLAREEGLLVGPSTGANVLAAFQAAATRAPSQAVLAFALDTGERYFSASMEPRG